MNKLTIFIFLVISTTSFSQTKNFIDQNFIEVTGKAEMEIAPNEIYLQIILNEKDYRGKQKIEELEKKMFSKLEEIGINVSEDLAVKDMTSNFKNYWIKSSTISAIKEFQLKVSNAKTAGTVFKELELLELSNISIIRVDHSELQEFKKKVKVAAIKAARKKANSLAAAIDQTCGRAIYIQEMNNRVYKSKQRYVTGATSNIMIRGASSISKSRQELAPEIEFEKIKLEYLILTRFELN